MMAVLLTVLIFVSSSFSLRFMSCVTTCHLASPLCLVPFVFYVILVTAVFQIL